MKGNTGYITIIVVLGLLLGLFVYLYAVMTYKSDLFGVEDLELDPFGKYYPSDVCADRGNKLYPERSYMPDECSIVLIHNVREGLIDLTCNCKGN